MLYSNIWKLLPLSGKLPVWSFLPLSGNLPIFPTNESWNPTLSVESYVSHGQVLGNSPHPSPQSALKTRIFNLWNLLLNVYYAFDKDEDNQGGTELYFVMATPVLDTWSCHNSNSTGFWTLLLQCPSPWYFWPSLVATVTIV